MTSIQAYAALASLAKPQVLNCKAQDGVEIRAFWYASEGPEPRPLIVVAPGFAQRHGLRPMSFITALLMPIADVLMVDARGTGKSGSRYTFGAREHEDIVAAWNAVPRAYPSRYLLGFSLGAYIALRAATEGGLRPEGVLLASCPTRVERLGFSILCNILIGPFESNGYVIPSETDLFFRWHSPFLGKPKAQEFAPQLRCPAHFLCGKRDLMIFKSLSKKVYDACPEPKTWTLWKDGLHAQAMALQHPEDFQAWVRDALATRA